MEYENKSKLTRKNFQTTISLILPVRRKRKRSIKFWSTILVTGKSSGVQF